MITIKELYLIYDEPMLIYVQRPDEKPFTLSARIVELSAQEIRFRCKTKIKAGEIIGVIFKVGKRDIMVNVIVEKQKKKRSTILNAEFVGSFIGLKLDQEQYIRKFVLYENLKTNRKRRIMRQIERQK